MHTKIQSHFLISFLFYSLILSVLSMNNSYSSEHTFSVDSYLEMPRGLNKVSQNSKYSETLVFIVGINENGSSWVEALEELKKRKQYNIYIYKWDKKQNNDSISRDIALRLNMIQEIHNEADIKVIAHSAGGVLLLDSLAYDSSYKDISSSISFYTVASPLGGYDYFIPGFMGLFIGPVNLRLGRRIEFKDLKESVNLTIMRTSFVHDVAMKNIDDYDMRYPSFKSDIIFSEVHLDFSSHNGAIIDAIKYLKLF